MIIASMCISMEHKKLKSRPFHFLNHWANWNGFEQLVVENWKDEIKGNLLYVFYRKLHRVKIALKKWSKEKVNLQNLIDKYNADWKKQTEILRFDPLNEEAIVSQRRIKERMDNLLNAEERYYCQLRRHKWIENGECNTSFYQSYARRREAKNALSELIDSEGRVINMQEDIERETISFIIDLYNKEPM